MIIGNNSDFFRNPGRKYGGLSASNIFSNTGFGSRKNTDFFYGNLNSIPEGYGAKGWRWPTKLGSMSSFTKIDATISSNVTAFAIGSPMEASLDANISSLPFQIALVSFFEASLSASGNLTNANATLLSNISASLSASGTISDADLFVLATIIMEANLTGGISLTPAQLSAAFFMAADLSASISTTNQIRITQNIEADIGGADPLSPQGLAQAVWNSKASDYTDAGSMGAVLNAAGAGGVDPSVIASAVWDALVTSHTDAGSMAELLKAIDTELKKKLNTSLFIAES